MKHGIATIQAVADLFTEDGVHLRPRSHIVGREAIRTFVDSLITGLPDLTVEVVKISPASDDDTVATEWRLQGTHSGTYAGMPASGNHIDVSGADFIQVVGGAIQSIRKYFDRIELMEQLKAR